MGDPKGFLKTARETPRRRPVDVRLSDWREVYEPFAAERTQRQAARCMDCGIPFCHNGCPLGNLWYPRVERRDLVYRSDRAAARASGCTPPITSRSSPGGCARRRARRPACSASTPSRSRSSRSRSRSSTAPGPTAGSSRRLPPSVADRVHRRRGVGSRPRRSLAAAQQLTSGRAPGRRSSRRPSTTCTSAACSRYGILRSSRWRSARLDRRIDQMTAEGTRFSRRRRIHVGRPARRVLRRRAGKHGWRAGRRSAELPVPGRELAAGHPPGDGVPARWPTGSAPTSPITAAGGASTW